jgi:hypothetical protein
MLKSYWIIFLRKKSVNIDNRTKIDTKWLFVRKIVNYKEQNINFSNFSKANLSWANLSEVKLLMYFSLSVAIFPITTVIWYFLHRQILISIPLLSMFFCGLLTYRCSGQESSRRWPDIKVQFGPALTVTTAAFWPTLSVTGPELFVTGQE